MIRRSAFPAIMGSATAALMLAGCAPDVPKAVPKRHDSGAQPVSQRPAPIRPPEEISIVASPCFGTCPTYRVTIFADGRGMFDGVQFTAVLGERAFVLKPPQFAQVAAILAPYRPADKKIIQEGASECGSFATDLPGRQVIWRAADGAQQLLDYNMGCMGAPQGLPEAIEKAIKAIPIAGFIEKHGNGAGSTIGT